MDTETQQAPPVVAVVVVHDPGAWFDETLAAFAAQDYPNLRMLFLLAPGREETAPPGLPDVPAAPTDVDAVTARIQRHLPGAFVRSLGREVGFGPAVNEVLRLVEGDNGFFLVCHDDVAPEPDALRVLVEEIYRSNAGAVGPKLVDWDDPHVLQSVGLGLDRFGEIDPVIEPGEVDQEQHDGVRDVFVLPSAYLLVRADLFRSLGGFDPSIDYHGEDVEFCWRLHHSGARVVVAPSARVRHRAGLRDRRPDLPHGRLEARHRMRALATLTGASRLLLRSIELVLLTLAELVVGVFSGRFAQAWTSLQAMLGLIPRTPALIARRREVRPCRQVPEREVYSLQERGSARLNSYLRSRETATYVAADAQVRRWRPSATAPVLAWLAVLAGIVIGGRTFFNDGVASVGEFLAFPESPRRLLDTFLSGWNPNGAGATSSNPTGWATLSGLSVVTLFRMGMLQTLFVLGSVVVGAAGIWRLATVFPSTRARIAALVVYVASPLVSGSMSDGRLTVLIVYASTPWFLHLVRRAAGIETADPRSADLDVPDGVVDLAVDVRTRRVLAAGIALAVAVAFAPVMLPMAVLLTLTFAAGTLVAQSSPRTALWSLAAGAGAVVVAALLNLPWIATWSWERVVGPPPVGEAGLGLLTLASFEIGTTDFAALALALYLPVVASVALAMAWRLTWAVRAGTLVLVFGALAVLADRGSLPVPAPEAGVLLVPVAVGVALAAAAALAAFDLDVRGGSFGWRQPLGILASVAVIVGVVPGVLSVTDGSFQQPTTTLARLLDRALPDAVDAGGDYNVLLLGDARILPVPSTEYRTGVSWAIVDDGDLDAKDRWMPPPNAAADVVTTALDEMAASSTLRAGRLLAPLGIRYIVVPAFDGVVSTFDDPLGQPVGLVEALEDQLDLVAPETRLPTVDLFENRAWLPTYAVLGGEAAQASRSAGSEVLVRSDLSDATAVFVGADQFGTATDRLDGEVLHVAVPEDGNWAVEVEGVGLEPRRAFGSTTAFDLPTVGGAAEFGYDTPLQRPLLVALQVVLWIVALVAVSQVRLPTARRPSTVVTDETLIDLSEQVTEPEPGPAIDPGLAPSAGAAAGATDTAEER